MTEMAPLTSIAVVDLMRKHFVIPSYQRGYRWTPLEVKALLDDLWAFKLASDQDTNSRRFYCLQPLVVSKRPDGSLEVLDGQQRLTTIYLILRYMEDLLKASKATCFTIAYDTRGNSADYLKTLDPATRGENIDFYHIHNAYLAIQEWFEKNDGRLIHIYSTLLNTDEVGKNVKFILYDVTAENRSTSFAIDVFSRINIGKIPLTSGELIKALLIQEAAKALQIQKAAGRGSETRLPPWQIASEWDAMEKRLQDDAFWHFLYPRKAELAYATRLDYLFDLSSKRTKKHEQYFTFHFFLGKLHEAPRPGKTPGVEDQWMEIRRLFQTLEEWFRHREIYHLVGFLVECGVSLSDLLDDAVDATKTSFLDKLKLRVAKEVPPDISELDYKNPKTRTVLLLFNILSILEAKEADSRFSFSRFKNEGYDLEHVRSQKDQIFDAKGRQDWIRMVLTYLEKESCEDVPERRNEFATLMASLKVGEYIDENTFTNTQKKVMAWLKESEPLEGSDHISNLALLDAKTNRSYKNAPFPIKRKTILERDQKGIFVPLGTRNLFLKVYSRNRLEVHLKAWDDEDAKDYLQEIQRVLQPYIKLKVVTP